MKISRIAPHPVLTDDLLAQLDIRCDARFMSSGPDPGAQGAWGEQFTLGHDAEWDPHEHDLTVVCAAEIDGMSRLFGAAGIAPRSATLAVALEWLSPDSGWRLLSEPCLVRMPAPPPACGTVQLSLRFPPDSLRGTGMFFLQLLLNDPGTPGTDELALARTPGFRFGALGPGTRVVIDGDGSLFPVVEESAGADAPLWQFTKDWSDPIEDEFSAVWLSLTLNRDHPDFPSLRGPATGSWTPLFCQVVSAWITTFLLELRADMDADFGEIEIGRIGRAQPGSIAHAAATMIRHGPLDCSSPAALAYSVQQWIDTTIRQPREAQ